jgi:hypothetical protein
MKDNFDNLYVTNIHDEIAKHFSSTRYSHWNGVKKCIDNFNSKCTNSKEQVNFIKKIECYNLIYIIEKI